MQPQPDTRHVSPSQRNQQATGTQSVHKWSLLKGAMAVSDAQRLVPPISGQYAGSTGVTVPADLPTSYQHIQYTHTICTIPPQLSTAHLFAFLHRGSYCRKKVKYVDKFTNVTPYKYKYKICRVPIYETFSSYFLICGSSSSAHCQGECQYRKRISPDG